MGVMNEDRLTLYDGLIKTHITNTTVAKETGKGLSTNDYTTTEKNKLAGIATGANKTIVDSTLKASSTNPVQNKVVYTEFGKKLDKNGDSKDLTNTFVSQDSTNVTQWTDVDVLASAEKHSSVFNKISTMFKNIRYLYKTLGTADISTLGEGANIGTVTGALSKLNSDYLGIGTWEDLVIDHVYFDNRNCIILQVNKTLRLVHISFTTYPGIPNQHDYLVIPEEFIPEYLKGFHGYNGLLICEHRSEDGMIENIILNGDGGLRSSHSTNTETTESTFVDFWLRY